MTTPRDAQLGPEDFEAAAQRIEADDQLPRIVPFVSQEMAKRLGLKEGEYQVPETEVEPDTTTAGGLVQALLKKHEAWLRAQPEWVLIFGLSRQVRRDASRLLADELFHIPLAETTGLNREAKRKVSRGIQRKYVAPAKTRMSRRAQRNEARARRDAARYGRMGERRLTQVLDRAHEQALLDDVQWTEQRAHDELLAGLRASFDAEMLRRAEAAAEELGMVEREFASDDDELAHYEAEKAAEMAEEES